MFQPLQQPLTLLVALAIGTGAVTGCKGGEQKAEATPAPVLTVSTTPAETRALEQPLTLTGSVAAWDTLPVMPGANGLRIVQVLAEEGQTVRKGQLLVKLDDATLQAQHDQARARVATAQANLRNAEDAHRRFAALEAEGGVSAAEMMSRRIALDTARAQLAEATAAQANVAALLSQTRVLAPTAGLITRRDAHLGDVSTVGKALFTMVRDNRLQMEALVAEADLGRVKPGQPVTVTSDAQPDLKVVGRVRQVSPTIDATSRQATAEIDLPPGSGFSVGMFVRGRVDTGARQVLAVPASAVRTTAAGAQVFVLEEGFARARKVETGSRAGEWVAIVSGLAPGAAVITAGAGFLKDGDKVSVAPALKAQPTVPATGATPMAVPSAHE